jgi:hypothetical protein
MVSFNVNISTLSCYSWNTNVGVFSLSSAKIWMDILQFRTSHSFCPNTLCWVDVDSVPTTKWLRVRFRFCGHYLFIDDSQKLVQYVPVCLLGHSCNFALLAIGVKVAKFDTSFWSSLGDYHPLKIVCLVRICDVWRRLHFYRVQSKSKQNDMDMYHFHDMTPHCWAEEVQASM